MRMASNTDRACLHGQMDQSTSEILQIITARDMVYSHGLMAELMKVNGSITKWKAMEFSHGKIKGNTRDNSSVT